MLLGFVIGSWAGAARASDGLNVGPGQLSLVLGDQANALERRATELFVAEIRRRTGLDVPIASNTTTKYALAIGTPETSKTIADYVNRSGQAVKLNTDGFHLMSTPDDHQRIYLVGQSPSGVVAGMGKLLRLSSYTDGLLKIPALTLNDSPKMPIRGIYFATHFHNFYHEAPLEEVDHIIESCALWGLNYLHVWFDMHHFESIRDPAAQKLLARLKHFAQTARSVGMKFGLIFLANEAYASSPEHLRAKWRPGWWHAKVELCPSNPEGLALIGKWQAEVLDAFPKLDVVWSWPYDYGGCACEKCMPWGCNGFLRASEQLAGLFHKRFPHGQFFLSTWLFDSLDDEGKVNWDGLIRDVEYPGLFRYVRENKPAWLDGFVMGTHRTWIPKPLLKRPSPEKYLLANFPEISMYRMNPWGGFGANPLPDWSTEIADMVRGHIVGGWPYSEGIWEDINKFFWARFYWNPDQATPDILAEYAAYYFGPESAKHVTDLCHLLESTHVRLNWDVENLAEADEAWALMRTIDDSIPPWARSSWRWRLFYIRAAMDHVLKNQGHTTPEARQALQPLCDELVRIYHAQKTNIRPPPFDEK
jgi:hypothetical protein